MFSYILLVLTLILSLSIILSIKNWKPSLFPINSNFIYGHRGAPIKAPENTLYSFQKAYEKKVNGIELDVQITKDKILIVHHDPHLMKLTQINNFINSKNYDEIKKIDARGEKFKHIPFQHIPTLEQVIRELPEKTIINIELKSQRYLSEGMEVPLVKILKKYKLLNRSIVSCFNPIILWNIKKINNNIKTALLFHGNIPLIKYAVYFIKPDAIHININIIDKKFVDWANRLRLPIFVYTVNTNKELEKLDKLDVDGIITDCLFKKTAGEII